MERLEEHGAVLFCLFDEDAIQPPRDKDDMDRWELLSQPCCVQGTTQSLEDHREQRHIRRLLRLEQQGIRTIGVRGGDDVIPRAPEGQINHAPDRRVTVYEEHVQAALCAQGCLDKEGRGTATADRERLARVTNGNDRGDFVTLTLSAY
jgi:hypothetical protein